MKVLFLTPRFYPEIGGVEKHVLEVSQELIKRGFEISILTEKPVNYQSVKVSDKDMHEVKRSHISGKTKFSNFQKLNIYRLNFGKAGRLKLFRIWKQMWKNRKLIHDADIIHCHDVFIWYFPLRFLYPRKKVFTTFHGWEGIYPPRSSAKLIRKVAEKLSRKNICIGRYIEKWYGTHADEISYGAVRISNFKYHISNETNAKKRILFVGRISEDNGIKIYAECLKKLRNKKVDFEFSAVGDGPLKQEFEAFHKVYGFVENSQKYIQQADIIFTSSYLSILESLAHNKLVISVFHNPLKKDYLTLTSFKNNIIITNSSDVIVDKILQFMNNKKVDTQLSQGAIWAREQTWEVLTQQYITLWN